MKAVVITSYGGVEGIGVQEADTPPVPTADRVRVRSSRGGTESRRIIPNDVDMILRLQVILQTSQVWSSQAKWNQSARRFAFGKSVIAFLE